MALQAIQSKMVHQGFVSLNWAVHFYGSKSQAKEGGLFSIMHLR